MMLKRAPCIEGKFPCGTVVESDIPHVVRKLICTMFNSLQSTLCDVEGFR